MMDWTKINDVLSELKNNDEEAEELLNELDSHIKVTRALYNGGWPEQEIVYFWGHGVDQGIPLELARIVYRVFLFCASRGIDLADALEEVEKDRAA